MPKRTGSQGYIAAGEVVGEVVQLTGKLSRWRVRPPSPPTHILTRPHPPTCTFLCARSRWLLHPTALLAHPVPTSPTSLTLTLTR